MKILCNECGRRRGPKFFLRDARAKSGYRPKCKTCRGIKTIRGYGGPKPAGESLYHLHLERTRERLRRLRAEMIEAYGGACACCGESESKFLTLDHINNDGAAHRREVGRSVSFYSWLRREGYPRDGFELLCANCHLAKSYYGGCPHRA